MQNPDELRELAWVRHAVASGNARAIREKSHLTTGDVASAVQVTPVTVWRWEKNLRSPRGQTALRYGRLLRSLAQGAA
ncbi:helix-turn-helix transcriptional regulator [Kitasatospora sp. GP82]|uniref:helix-turn-helix transcriptional regulator n=1 Tax=Kitasatospora sp. GP82 TaxID=3035089 RepID=UPI0024749B03|nr:helix-turn-helix transcriptional regulator [Kitasatospora sp. GP82]MDH6125918.1 DNA-binding transcriptional regulator YiaG [Kitasatospora sp. GP82]